MRSLFVVWFAKIAAVQNIPLFGNFHTEYTHNFVCTPHCTRVLINFSDT